jgi:CTP synthase (UTP-ammonia lyase)
MAVPIRIGIIGDFEPVYHSHFATNAALYDAATKLKVPLQVRWLPTSSLEGPDAEKILRRWDGLIASPGSPYKSFGGMLRGIEFARTRDWPFVGT